MNDSLGDRMKNNYEFVTRSYLPRRTYTICRIDGKSFHSWTKGLKKPFDRNLISVMANTTKYLCENIQGVQCGYTQSDEISLLLTDFEDIHTESWFTSNIQKMVSVSASMATAYFNDAWTITGIDKPLAFFDSRVFTIPDPVEVENYFIYRNNDCSRNSINCAAQSKFSHKELQGKNTDECQEMLFQKHGINWATHYTDFEKNGSFVGKIDGQWEIQGGWKFTTDREKLKQYIPRIWETK